MGPLDKSEQSPEEKEQSQDEANLIAFAECISLLMSFGSFRNEWLWSYVSWRREPCSVPAALPSGKLRAALARKPLLEDFIWESSNFSLEFSISSEMLRPKFFI